MVLGRLTSKLAKEQHRKAGMMLLGAFVGASVLLFVCLGSMWIISDRIMEFIDEFVAVTHLAVDDLELYVNQFFTVSGRSLDPCFDHKITYRAKLRQLVPV